MSDDERARLWVAYIGSAVAMGTALVALVMALSSCAPVAAWVNKERPPSAWEHPGRYR